MQSDLDMAFCAGVAVEAVKIKAAVLLDRTVVASGRKMDCRPAVIHHGL
jgi:hypothetical protein